MYFNADDDDDNGFTPIKSSNLASLFESDKHDAKHATLTYTAPKQPKRQRPDTPKGDDKVGRSSVFHVTVAHAYKFEENKHNHQGKVGVAIVGNHDSSLYGLLLYKVKNETVARAMINVNFLYTVQPNNYASFYDDQRNSWSINFEGVDTAFEFSKQIAIAKANSAGGHLETVITQDLVPGKGSTIESADMVNVKYTGWILSNFTFGQVFDSNEASDKPLTLKVGSGKMLKAVETGMIGMKREGQRLIIVPPSLGIGTQGTQSKVPNNATLIFSVSVKDDGTPPCLPSSQEIESKKLETPGGESIVKTHGTAISEHLQNMSPKSGKAKLISRMAKMGQPMLPMPGAVVAHSLSSESDAEEESKSPGTFPPSSSPEHLPRPLPRMQPPSKTPAAPYVSSDGCRTESPLQSQGMLAGHPVSVNYPIATKASLLPNTNPYMLGSLIPGQSFITSTSTIDAHLPVMLTEVKAQNSELRLHINQVADKVDRILGKLDHPLGYPTMEAGMLAHNIQHIIGENEALKVELKDKTQKIESLTDKISDLLRHNQKFLEQSSTMIEQRCDLQSSSVQTLTKLAVVEQEKSSLLSELDTANKKIVELQAALGDVARTKRPDPRDDDLISRLKYEKASITAEYQVLQKSLSDALQTLTSMEESLKREQMKSAEREERFEALSSKYDAAVRSLESERAANTKELPIWKDKIQEYEENVRRLQSHIYDLQKAQTKSGNVTEPDTNIVEQIKKIMNATYRSLQRQFQATETYTGQTVKEVLVSTIRDVTLELLDHFDSFEKSAQPSDPESNKLDATKTEETSQAADADKGEDTKSEVEDAKSIVENAQLQVEDQHQSEAKEEEIVLPSLQHSSEETGAAVESVETSGKEGVGATSQKEVKEDFSESWKPQPPPLFDEDSSDADDDDWLK